MELRREKGTDAAGARCFSAQLEAEVYAYTAQLPRFAAFPVLRSVSAKSIG
jgi:hypothetical protein